MDKSSFLVQYLRRYTASIGSLHRWNPHADRACEILGSALNGATRFEQTLDLKRQLHLAIRQARDPARNLELARFLVQEWGCMGAITDETLNQMVRMLEPLRGEPHPGHFRFPIANIGSASMWLSVLCPEWAAIYYSRVAWALNAINVITHAGAKVFPVLRGRDSTLNALDAGTLALAAGLRAIAVDERPTAIENIHEQRYVARLHAYVYYLDVLLHAHWGLWPERTPLAYTELLLFGLADTVIFRDLVAAI